MWRPVESPFVDHGVVSADATPEWSAGAALAAESPFLDELDDGRLFEALVPPVSQATLRSRIEDYFRLAEAEYTIPAHTPPGGTAVAASTVRARPQFRFARGVSQRALAGADTRLRRLVGPALSAAQRNAIGPAVLGRARPGEIAAITQALIDRGQLDAVRAATGLTGAALVRALQAAFAIGIDCAGYVQLAFVFAYTGSDADTGPVRAGLGLKPKRTHEALRDLPARHFRRVPIPEARTGDLFVLRPRPNDDGAWHTVIVLDRTAAGSVHTFVVHASWGIDMYGAGSGGVGERTWQHDTLTQDWWDIAPDDRDALCGGDVKAGEKACVNRLGPYGGHRPFGMFRPIPRP